MHPMPRSKNWHPFQWFISSYEFFSGQPLDQAMGSTTVIIEEQV
jgi:hypothetical protein